VPARQCTNASPRAPVRRHANTCLGACVCGCVCVHEQAAGRSASPSVRQPVGASTHTRARTHTHTGTQSCTDSLAPTPSCVASVLQSLKLRLPIIIPTTPLQLPLDALRIFRKVKPMLEDFMERSIHDDILIFYCGRSNYNEQLMFKELSGRLQEVTAQTCPTSLGPLVCHQGPSVIGSMGKHVFYYWRGMHVVGGYPSSRGPPIIERAATTHIRCAFYI
jgi:hypothetical protein